MKFEKSCGVIVFTRINGQIKYVIEQSINGHYGFPKGHVEQGETETETALREVYEEVGLKPSLTKGFRETVEYYIPSVNVQKTVVYFLGLTYTHLKMQNNFSHTKIILIYLLKQTNF